MNKDHSCYIVKKVQTNNDKMVIYESVPYSLAQLCQKTFIPFNKSEIKIEKALQSQLETIIVIYNTIENNRILLTT